MGVGVGTTKEGATDTARNAMVGTFDVIFDNLRSSNSHRLVPSIERYHPSYYIPMTALDLDAKKLEKTLGVLVILVISGYLLSVLVILLSYYLGCPGYPSYYLGCPGYPGYLNYLECPGYLIILSGYYFGCPGYVLVMVIMVIIPTLEECTPVLR